MRHGAGRITPRAVRYEYAHPVVMFKLFKKNNSSGFTLIELLVVIAIIGVLASVVLASLNTARRKSRDARRIADIKQIQLALELYFDANGEYPDAMSSLAPSFIPAVPADPSGSAYDYDNLDSAGAACAAASGECTLYHLGGDLEESTNPALDNDSDGCAASGTGCTRIMAGTTLSGRDDTGNDCVGAATNVYCYDVTP